MSGRRKILVAMSGGVDSSVAAALLREAGHEVVGAFMCLGHAGEVGGTSSAQPAGEAAPAGQADLDEEVQQSRRQSCCSIQDSDDARRVAARLGIPFYILDFQAGFDGLIDQFVSEYSRGRTPNPCVLCNSRLKFGRLLDYAATIGADAVATGHYARIVPTGSGPRLAQAADATKDQSYVLFDLLRETLGRVEFPLGEWAKRDVRAKAAALGLGVADKPDSQDICFVPDGDIGGFIERHRPGSVRSGDVLNPAGHVVGRHRGYQHYTIGQRRGVGVAAGVPIYVTAIDPAANTVTVGPAAGLLRSHLACRGVVWHIAQPAPGERIPAFVKIRYRAESVPATVIAGPPGAAAVQFARPVPAVTPGQAAVFYDAAGLVIGGGWIE